MQIYQDLQAGVNQCRETCSYFGVCGGGAGSNKYWENGTFLGARSQLKIIGKTPSGRATCNRLDLNDERREEPFIQNARRQWIVAQLHPPQ